MFYRYKNIGYITELCNIKNNFILGRATFSIQKGVCNIKSIYVPHGQRNSKIGTELLTEIEKHSIDNSVNKISMLVYSKPISCLEEFYKKNGFESQQNIKTRYYDDGVTVYDLIYMEKKL